MRGHNEYIGFFIIESKVREKKFIFWKLNFF